MKVLSITELYTLFNLWNDGELAQSLVGEEILIVHKRSNMIVGKVKILKPPKVYKDRVNYYLPKDRNYEKDKR